MVVALSYALPVTLQPEQLHLEVAALAIAGFLGINVGTDHLQVLFKDEVSAPDELRVRTTVGNHLPDQLFNTRGQRQTAISLLSDPSPQQKLQRATSLAFLDQLNIIRAALPVPLAPLTRLQWRALVVQQLNGGQAD